MSRYKAVWAKSQPQVNPRVLDAWVLDTSDNSTVKRFPAMTLLEAQSAMRLAKRLASSLNRPEPYFAPETRIQPRVEFWEKDGYWKIVVAAGGAADSEHTRRQTRDRSCGHYRKSFCWNEEPRCLRDARWRDSAFCPSTDRSAHHGPRSHAFAGQFDSEIQRTGLQWFLVLARARSVASVDHRNAARRERTR
jgi:hypothetical protein